MVNQSTAMLEFSNLIKVTPTAEGSTQTYEFVADSFSYAPQLTDNDAGSHWNCDKTVVIDRPEDAVRRFFTVERNAIVTVRTSDRRPHYIGTKLIPARVQISSNLTTCTLIIKCKMLSDPLL